MTKREDQSGVCLGSIGSRSSCPSWFWDRIAPLHALISGAERLQSRVDSNPLQTDLSLSNGRRRWACRAARRGGKGGAGCRHFHVHYHIPRQVWEFSPLRLPARCSLLPYLMILPVLFFAVLAFLVCFGWFTLVYFMSSLWSKGNDHELCLVHSANSSTSDASVPPGEDERGNRAVKRVTEYVGDSGLPEVCAESRAIKEVFEDEFSEESWRIKRMRSSGICIDDKEHANDEKIVKEVMVFETKQGLKAFTELYCSSEEHQQVMDIPIDCSLDEFDTREFTTSLMTAKLLDVPYGEEFVSNKKEMSVLSSLEILEFIDKHDTEEILVNGAGNDLEMPEVSSSDDSAHHGLRDEHRKEIKPEQSKAELSANSVANMVEAIVDEWQGTQNSVIEHNNKLPEDDSMGLGEDGKQIVGISHESPDSLTETTRLPLDSLCENESDPVAVSNTPFHQATSGQYGELEEELINQRVESSSSASVVCHFADNHWRIIEQLNGFVNEENIHEDDSPVTSALQRVEDENEEIDDNFASMGASRRMPLIRRTPAQWWNLCGVLDVFAGGED